MTRFAKTPPLALIGVAAISLIAAGGLARAQGLFDATPITRQPSAPAPAPDPARALAPAPASAPANAAAPLQAQPAPIRPPASVAEPARSPALAAILGPASEREADGQLLRHLPNNAQGFRLTGEIATSEWPLYLTAAQTAAPLKFQVGYLASISTLPDASTLTVEINDVAIGATEIFAPSNVKTAIFDIPASLVKPGFNSLRIVVRMRHRVDCSLQATYELWTQIDPSRTGLILPSRDLGVASIADLAGLPPNPQGSFPIRAVLPGQTTARAMDWVVRASQILALNGRFEQPLVDVGAMADGYGVNLVVGLYEQIRSAPGLERLRPPPGPMLQILQPTADRRTTIIVTGNAAEEVDKALDQLAAAAPSVGSEAGLRAMANFPGARVDGGQRLKLRDVGLSSQEFAGRLFRAGFNIIMPSDFYPADYGKAELRLAGGYAAGLIEGAQVIVNVNGRNAVGLPLPNVKGDVFKDRVLPIPLGMLRPGLNRIDVEAHLPMAADRECIALGVGDAVRKRFLFLAETELKLPDIARMATIPNLAVTATGGFPYAAAAVSNLYMPRPDRDTLGAAATIAARMSVAGGRVIPFRLTTRPPAPDTGPTLAIGAATAFTPGLLAAAGVPVPATPVAAASEAAASQSVTRAARISVLEATMRQRLALQRNFPAECNLRGAPTLSGATVEAAVGQSGDGGGAGRNPAPGRSGGPGAAGAAQPELFDRWRSDVKGSGVDLSNLASAISGLGGWAVDAAARLGSGALDLLAWREETIRQAPADAPLVIAQTAQDRTKEGILTVITAPTSLALREAVGCVVDPRVWSGVAGQLSALDPAQATMQSVKPSLAWFVSTQPLSVSNMRLVAAGWFSLNRWAYVAATTALAILLGLATFWLVSNVGRRQPS